jgi:hypothetical protein
MIFSHSLIHRLKQIVSYKLVRNFWIKIWVLGRDECLGKAVIDRLDSNITVFNIQKGCVDYWISCYKNDIAARLSIIKPHVKYGYKVFDIHPSCYEDYTSRMTEFDIILIRPNTYIANMLGNLTK